MTDAERAREKGWLRAQIAETDSLLAELPEDHQIERIGLRYMRARLAGELDALLSGQ